MEHRAEAVGRAPFNLMDAGDDFRTSPYATYRMLRDEYPLLQNPDGSYVLTRWQDVDAVLRSHDTTVDKSEAYRKVMGDGAILEFQLGAMTTWDPPGHTKLRGSLAMAFTPRAMAQWEPLVRDTVDELLVKPRQNGSMDLVSEFSAALPLTLICKMLGVPTENSSRFRGWARSITSSLDPGAKPDIITLANQHSEEWKEFFRGLMAARRKNPGNDLISMLLTTDQGEEAFSEVTLIHNIALLMSAGHETTTSLIANAIDALIENPDQAERLRKNPELITTAVEEFLRYDSPVQMGSRRSIAPITVSGGTIPANSYIWTVQGAANRDEREFRDSDRLDVGRTPNRHIAFATGVHVCLGAPLARMEARFALERLVNEFPNLRRASAPERFLRTRFRAFTKYPVLL